MQKRIVDFQKNREVQQMPRREGLRELRNIVYFWLDRLNDPNNEGLRNPDYLRMARSRIAYARGMISLIEKRII